MPHEDELVPMGITKRGGPAFLKGTYTSSPPQTTQAETCGNPPNALVRVQNHRIGGASVYSPMIMLLMSTKQWRIPVFAKIYPTIIDHAKLEDIYLKMAHCEAPFWMSTSPTGAPRHSQFLRLWVWYLRIV